MHQQRLIINEKHELSFVKHLITNKDNFEKNFISTNIEQS